MAITLTQHKFTRSAANAVTVAVTVTATGASRLIVVCAGNADTRTVTGVTDNKAGGSNVYVQATSANGVNGVHETDIWYCLSAGAGVTTVTVTYSGSATTFNKEAEVFEVAGFTSCAFDLAGNLTSGTGVGTTDTGPSITTTSTIGFIAAIIVTTGFITVNPKAGNEFSSGGDIFTTSDDAACSLISTTAAAHQPVWTDGSSGSAICASVAAFKEASASFIPDDDSWKVPVPAGAEQVTSLWC